MFLCHHMIQFVISQGSNVNVFGQHVLITPWPCSQGIVKVFQQTLQSVVLYCFDKKFSCGIVMCACVCMYVFHNKNNTGYMTL